MHTDDYEDPRKPDPRFPDRPTHEDFVRLSEIVQENDFKAERLGYNPLQMADVDEKSLLYFLENRLGTFARLTGVEFLADPRNQSLLSALWIDAFVAGRAFERGDR